MTRECRFITFTLGIAVPNTNDLGQGNSAAADCSHCCEKAFSVGQASSFSMGKAFASVGGGDGVIWSRVVGRYTFDGKQQSGVWFIID